MTSLSTHVLDTVNGCPAAGVAVRLVAGAAPMWQGWTDGDGRCRDLPDLTPGRYRLEFGVADYFREKGVALADPPFLDWVGIDFGVADGGHYHVPLLVSPFAYSTYRGS
jgi:5-hydroxyisourate hydrolase